MTTIIHGRRSTYVNHKCRCVPCVAANTDELRRIRHERYAYVKKYGLPDDVEHGASAYTNWGCKCDVCTVQHVARCRDYKEKRRAEGASKAKQVRERKRAA